MPIVYIFHSDYMNCISPNQVNIGCGPNSAYLCPQNMHSSQQQEFQEHYIPIFNILENVSIREKKNQFVQNYSIHVEELHQLILDTIMKCVPHQFVIKLLVDCLMTFEKWDFKEFAEIKKATRLVLPNNRNIIDVNFLTLFQNLTYLSLVDTSVFDISVLRDLRKLQSLQLSTTQVQCLCPIRHMKKLKTLNIHRTPIQDLSPIVDFEELTSVITTETRLPTKYFVHLIDQLDDVQKFLKEYTTESYQGEACYCVVCVRQQSPGCYIQECCCCCCHDDCADEHDSCGQCDNKKVLVEQDPLDTQLPALQQADQKKNQLFQDQLSQFFTPDFIANFQNSEKFNELQEKLQELGQQYEENLIVLQPTTHFADNAHHCETEVDSGCPTHGNEAKHQTTCDMHNNQQQCALHGVGQSLAPPQYRQNQVEHYQDTFQNQQNAIFQQNIAPQQQQFQPTFNNQYQFQQQQQQPQQPIQNQRVSYGQHRQYSDRRFNVPNVGMQAPQCDFQRCPYAQ